MLEKFIGFSIIIIGIVVISSLVCVLAYYNEIFNDEDK